MIVTMEVPKPARSTAILSQAQWEAKHAYFIECMLAMVRHALRNDTSAAVLRWDWPSLQEDFIKMAYRTSETRYKGFRLFK